MVNETLDVLDNLTTIISANKISYQVVRLLYCSREGKVYDVIANNQHYFMKWFDNMVKTRSYNVPGSISSLPDKPLFRSFRLPIDWVFNTTGELLGYLIDFIPESYTPLKDFFSNNHSVLPPDLLHATAVNLIKNFMKLHSKGCCFKNFLDTRDIVFNNTNGDVLVCVSDNIVDIGAKVPDDANNADIFLSPEILNGSNERTVLTDLYSLAVFLFLIFMSCHPLTGEYIKHFDITDIEVTKTLYGHSHIFVFDPNSSINRPDYWVKERWNASSESLKALFIRAFTEGLEHPDKRVTEDEWLHELNPSKSSVMFCPYCGSEVTFDSEQSVNKKMGWCRQCEKDVVFNSKVFNLKPVATPITKINQKLAPSKKPNEEPLIPTKRQEVTDEYSFSTEYEGHIKKETFTEALRLSIKLKDKGVSGKRVLRNILLDRCQGQYEAEIECLCSFMDIQIIDEIKKQNEVNNSFAQRVLDKTLRKHPYQRDIVIWGIMVWIEVYGDDFLNKSFNVHLK